MILTKCYSRLIDNYWCRNIMMVITNFFPSKDIVINLENRKAPLMNHFLSTLKGKRKTAQ